MQFEKRTSLQRLDSTVNWVVELLIIFIIVLVGSILEDYQIEIIVCLCGAVFVGGLIYVLYSPQQVSRKLSSINISRN